MNRFLAVLVLLGGCASVFGWEGAAQRDLIVFGERGEVLKQSREGDLVIFVWRQGPRHYHKWICNTGYVHNCFDDYSVDQIARVCCVAHEGPEQVVDCGGLRQDADLAQYITW